MSLVVFEDEGWRRFVPLSYTRHMSELLWGTRSILESIMEATRRESAILWGREYLESVCRERLGTQYNTRPEQGALFVNARARPTEELRRLAGKEGVAVFSGGSLLLATPGSVALQPGVVGMKSASRLTDGLERQDAEGGALFENYWDMIESNGSAIALQSSRAGWVESLPRNVSLNGPASNLRIDPGAQVDEFVAFDTGGGPVVVEEGAVIQHFSRLSGPCFIGRGARVQSALIRGGTSIFEQCRIGGEVENAILMPFTNKAHHGYVGDTIVGEWVNIGAGCTFSNLKNTYGSVRARVGSKRVETGRQKLGPVVADMAKLSIGALVFAGKAVGVSSHVLGLADDDVPSFTYWDGQRRRLVELKLESVVETQRRMMERRGKAMTKSQELLIEHLFQATYGERRRAGARSGKI
jgi:UDP-N-acetylglucosamine diphosphorylase/glucosamine-1-phosphate N-acetyltransferase